MNREECYNLAKIFGLNVASVTCSTNGCPQNVQLALVGFDNFEQAEEVANEYDLTIVRLYKRFGWEKWAVQGKARGPIDFFAEVYGDDYISFDSSWNEYDFISILRRSIDGIKEPDGIFDIIDFFKELKKILDDISEDEQVVARMYDKRSISVINKELMVFYDYINSCLTAIAVI